MRPNDDGTAVGVDADLDAVVALARMKRVDVVLEQSLDEFRDASAARALGDEIGFILDRGQSVGDRDGIAARLQERVVVLGVADRHDVVRGEAQVPERRFQAACFVDAGRENHDCSLVEDNLQLKSVFADRLENQLFVWLPGRDDGSPDGQRTDALPAQGLNQFRRGFGTERGFLFRGGVE